MHETEEDILATNSLHLLRMGYPTAGRSAWSNFLRLVTDKSANGCLRYTQVTGGRWYGNFMQIGLLGEDFVPTQYE